MRKEQLANFKDMPEEELRALLGEAREESNYLQELMICEALWKYEENPNLASNYIKKLDAYIKEYSAN